MPSKSPELFYDRKLETLSRKKLNELQDKRFRKLQSLLLKSNPFYRQKLHEAGIRKPMPLNRISELPFTIKAELMADQAAHPPFGNKLTFSLERYTRLHQTSGTTGAPLRWPDTPESWHTYVREWGFVLRGAGVAPGDRVFVAFSFGPFIGFWGAFEGAQHIGAMALTGGGQTTEQRIATMCDWRPTVLVCTPTYALRLAEVAQSHGVETAKMGIRITVHAGEPGAGIPSTRRRIEEYWGSKAYDHVGMTEVGAYGYECSKQLGPHTNETEYIIEVIDPATSKPVEDGRRGEVILTTLGREGSPLIRYRTGDLAEVTRKRCACGRTFALLKGGILGRADDMITVRGVNVFPSAIENILWRFPEIVEFQGEVVIQREMQELLLRVETAGMQNRQHDALAERIVTEMRTTLNLRPTVEFAPPGSLPRPELKARRFRCAPPA
ncbi:MAG: AMP-binding protein [Acidobacteria bacterium]|nr:AMP-binding protein [Acidobacteriota bacterium]